MSGVKRTMEIGREYFLERADRDIEKYRKGDFCITVLKDGKPFDTEVSYKLKKIDFDFGCNIFMLDQYENEGDQERYLELWKNLFNTAVVPLYWEGTEPQKDCLKYTYTLNQPTPESKDREQFWIDYFEKNFEYIIEKYAK